MSSALDSYPERERGAHHLRLKIYVCMASARSSSVTRLRLASSVVGLGCDDALLDCVNGQKGSNWR